VATEQESNYDIVNTYCWYLAFAIYSHHVNEAKKKKKKERNRFVQLPSKLLLNAVSNHIQSFGSFQSN